MDNEYYDLLNVPRTATKDEIKKAYKEIARKSHPDKGGDAEKFKKINEAYGVLSDDNLRSRYDNFGKNDAEIPHHFPDFFNMFPFPMNHHNQMHKRTPNRTMDLELTMEESFHGANVKYRYKRKVFTGDIHSATCHKCNGNGKIVEQIRAPIGIIQNVTICPACTGVGVSVSEDQFQTITEIVDLHIPPCSGIGKQVVLHGKSDEMPKMQTGDIVLTIVIKKHPIFELIDDKDIIWKISVHPLEALTSFSRSVKLPSNEIISVVHQPNDGFFSSLDKKRVLRGKGLFSGNGERGNVFISFVLEDFYVADQQALYRLCETPIPIYQPDGMPLDTIPIEEQQHQTQQHQQAQQQQQHHQTHHFRAHHPHVQECRPS